MDGDAMPNSSHNLPQATGARFIRRVLVETELSPSERAEKEWEKEIEKMIEDAQQQQISNFQNAGFQVTVNPDGSITASRPGEDEDEDTDEWDEEDDGESDKDYDE